MDPNVIKLNYRQKIRLMIAATLASVQWLELAVLFLYIVAWIKGTDAIPMPREMVFLRVVLGFALASLVVAIAGVIMFILQEHVVPTIQQTRSEYNALSYRLKKKILDNIIDDEVLK